MNKRNIRSRDKYRYQVIHGAIPAGMSMHHLWYSEEYDENSFIIISKEDHEKIHRGHIDYSVGTHPLDRQKMYNNLHRSEINSRQVEYYHRTIDERRAYDKMRYERDKCKRREITKKNYLFDSEVCKFFNISHNFFNTKCSSEVRAFMREVYKGTNGKE